MKKVSLKYIVINFLDKVLSALVIEGQPSHARRRFLRDIKPHVQDLQAEQDELRKSHAEKNEKGETRIENGQYVFTANKRKEFNKKWDALNEQEVLIDVTPANEADFATVQTIIKNEADRYEKDDVTEGKFNADNFEYVASLREAADMLTAK